MTSPSWDGGSAPVTPRIPAAFDRPRLRAALFLGSVLPLLEPYVREWAPARRLVSDLRGTVQFEAPGLAARLLYEGDGVRVRAAHDPGGGLDADVRVRFGTHAAMSAFFTGRPALPALSGALWSPRLVVQTARLLAGLRFLEPPRPGAPLPPPEERALRVRLLLTLVTRALTQLHREGHPEMAALVAESPERVYQWTVGDGTVGAWVRMERGRMHCGPGVYTRRRPFVHFVFADVDAAFAVLTATGSQMGGFRGGAVQTFGSPEYTRKIALLMQKVDELLVEG